MRNAWIIAFAALVLAACGPGGVAGGAGARENACALVPAPESIFGRGAVAEDDGVIAKMAGSCRFAAADARRTGDLIVYTAGSVGGTQALAARYAEVAAEWRKMTATPLAPLPEIGAQAQLAVDLPGYQTQILFLNGDRLVLIMGGSGDPRMSGEAIARAMAKAVAAAP